MRVRAWLTVVGSIGVAIGCSTFGSTDTQREVDPPVDGGSDCGALCQTDAGADDAMPRSPCPSRGGPMVLVETLGFCVDRTEVTVGQYATFLQAMSEQPSGGIPAQPPECGWNTSFKPPYWWPATPDEEDAGKSKSEVDAMPVGVVDWCDARAFCAWAGKRLCGRMGGGKLATSEAATTTSEWFVACSRNGLHAFPYGDQFVAGACNGVDSPAREPVGARTGCTGGYDGLVDMSGNVQEWIDACDVEADGGSRCALSGGVYGFPATSLGCDGLQRFPRTETIPQIGFRCCAAPAGP